MPSSYTGIDEGDIQFLKVIIAKQREMIEEKEIQLAALKEQLGYWEKELVDLVEGQLILKLGEW